MTAAEKTAWDALQADRDALFAENANLGKQNEDLRNQSAQLLEENEALKKASAELLAENDALKVSAPTVAVPAPAGPVEYVIDPNDPEPAQDPYAGTLTPAWKAWAERRTLKQ